jgi:hypothetical protein
MTFTNLGRFNQAVRAVPNECMEQQWPSLEGTHRTTGLADSRVDGVWTVAVEVTFPELDAALDLGGPVRWLPRQGW